MNNPLQFVQIMRNPQAFIQKMMNNSQLTNNPMAKNLLEMAKNGDVAKVEEFGRNMAKERGVDFDQAFNSFRNQFPMQ